jgi:hypothetical protein
MIFKKNQNTKKAVLFITDYLHAKGKKNFSKKLKNLKFFEKSRNFFHFWIIFISLAFEEKQKFTLHVSIYCQFVGFKKIIRSKKQRLLCFLIFLKNDAWSMEIRKLMRNF